MREALVADFTKAFPGKLEDALRRVEGARVLFKVDPKHLVLVGREDQQEEAQKDHRWQTASVDSAVSTIDSILVQLARENDRPDFVRVVSYNVEVLGRYGAARTGPMTVASLHFSSLENPTETTSPNALHSGLADAEESPAPENRSARIEAAIRAYGYGPYSAIRPKLYEELARAIPSSSGRALRVFVSECLDGLKAKLPDQNGRYRWERVRDTVIKILTEAKVVLGTDGSPIQSGPQGRLALVGSLDTDWQIKADAELALVAIEKLGDVSEFDYPELAGALYHSRTPDAEDKVAAALAELERQGRIQEVREHGITYLRSSPPS